MTQIFKPYVLRTAQASTPTGFDFGTIYDTKANKTCEADVTIHFSDIPSITIRMMLWRDDEYDNANWSNLDGNDTVTPRIFELLNQ
jgi:hypothetical protein